LEVQKYSGHSLTAYYILFLASGAQLRADDPTSLKDIINAIQSATEKRDTKTMS
jgi:hypothetical protein